MRTNAADAERYSRRERLGHACVSVMGRPSMLWRSHVQCSQIHKSMGMSEQVGVRASQQKLWESSLRYQEVVATKADVLYTFLSAHHENVLCRHCSIRTKHETALTETYVLTLNVPQATYSSMLKCLDERWSN